MNKGKGAMICAAITAIAAGGLSFTFDFSETNISSDDDTTIIGGDTVINLPGEAEIADAILKRVCELDLIPEEYNVACEEWNKP